MCACPGTLSPPSHVPSSRAAARRRAQEQIGFDALLLCDDADLKELGLAPQDPAYDARLGGQRTGAAGLRPASGGAITKR